jgi:poly(3-hydroxybutyrate) depolymerase
MAMRNNNVWRTLGGTGALMGVLALGACGSDDNAAPPSPTASTLACTQITTGALGLSGLKVASAVAVAASGSVGSDASAYPAHCQVTGSVNERTGIDGKPYAIGFEVRMPDASWNGKFFFQGGGGTDGAVNPALGVLPGAGATTNALSMGYAVVSTDAGHVTETDVSLGFLGGVQFALDPQARLDYGYNAVGTLTPLAKQIVQRRYGSAPSRSYFVGCSNGGRQAMVAAARFADQFDGVVAGDPGFNLPKAAVAEAWDTHQFLSVSPGNPAGAFTQAEMNTVAAAITTRCDALDGATDGLVQNSAACQSTFNLATDVPTCGGARDGSCLTTAQKTALQAIFDGAQDSSSNALYNRWPWDPGIAAGNWRVWKLEAAFLGGNSLNATLGAGALAYLFSTPPFTLANGAPSTLLSFMDTYPFDQANTLINATNATFTTSAMSFMTPPNATTLAAFKQRGKMIVYHGQADPVFSVQDTVDWYDQLRTGDSAAASFARLFVVPGMNHCSGGPTTDKFDAFGALVNWVEQGQAPEVITASVSPANAEKPAGWSTTRSRPLCAYPKRAVLKAGASDLDSADSFACVLN